jgi:hypothetical protein
MLIQCDECKKTVSDKAPTCPNCGAPIALIPGHINDVLPKRAGSSLETWGALMTISGVLLMMTTENNYTVLLALVGFVVFIAGRLK